MLFNLNTEVGKMKPTVKRVVINVETNEEIPGFIPEFDHETNYASAYRNKKQQYLRLKSSKKVFITVKSKIRQYDGNPSSWLNPKTRNNC